MVLWSAGDRYVETTRSGDFAEWGRDAETNIFRTLVFALMGDKEKVLYSQPQFSVEMLALIISKNLSL